MRIDDGISPKRLLKTFTAGRISSGVLVTRLSTPQISDALYKISGFNGAISSLRPLNAGRVAGRLITAKTMDYDWGTSVKAIDHARKSEVLFIMTVGDDNAVWGELTSKTAAKRKLGGTIIYGACRDLDAISELDFPVFSKKIVPNAGKPLGEGEINVELECEGVKIRPGDHVFGDESGVVIVPKKLLDDVIDEALKIKMKEAIIDEKIQEGIPLSRILGLK